MQTILLGVLMFTLVVIALVLLILAAKKALISAGNVKILVNDSKELSVPCGGKLLSALADQG
ncbi:MAG: NADH:ubiquinone reductase (Na(+)-transporting) subunit F, partial [Pirellulaceae bacterium]